MKSFVIWRRKSREEEPHDKPPPQMATQSWRGGLLNAESGISRCGFNYVHRLHCLRPEPTTLPKFLEPRLHSRIRGFDPVVQHPPTGTPLHHRAVLLINGSITPLPLPPSSFHLRSITCSLFLTSANSSQQYSYLTGILNHTPRCLPCELGLPASLSSLQKGAQVLLHTKAAKAFRKPADMMVGE